MALNEQRRTQLDGIVQQMVRNKESDNNIQFVVDDFKKKYESESLVQQQSIGQKRSGFSGFISDLIGSQTGIENEQGVEGVGGRFVGFGKGVLGTVKENLSLGGKILSKLPLSNGASISLPVMAGKVASIAGQAIPEESTKPLGVAERQGAAMEKIAEFGVPTGIGGKAATTVLKSRKIAKVSREAYEIVKPELSKVEKIAALESGRGKEVGKLGEIIITPSRRDLEVAKAVEGIVSKKKGFVQNIASLNSAIKKEAEVVRKGLEVNDVIFNQSQIAKKLSLVERPPLVASDATMNNAYELAQKKFMEFVAKEPKKLSGLLTARQKFDQWVENSFPGIFENESWRPLHTALRNMRTTANDYIASKLPIGSPFREGLKRQSLMFEAIENVANKSFKDVGTNIVERGIKKYPKATKALKYGVYGIAGTKGIKSFLD